MSSDRRIVTASMVALAVAWGAVACSETSRLKGRCTGGEVAACIQLGEMFANGTGVPRDMGRAADMYQQACNMGAVEVCNTLGEIYERGHETEGGLERAEALFRVACNGGSAAGCLNLGLVASTRDDKTHAAELYERSCTGGWTAGCHHLAMAFEHGEGVLVDLNRAIAVYEDACANKYAESCLSLASLYMSGERVERDLARGRWYYGAAVKLYDEGCQAGDQSDCKERDKLRARLAILAASQHP